MAYWGYFKPYVSVAQRRVNARREMDKLAKKGQKIQPIHIEGRKIATTFWGKAWCDNLESYSDFANRLPRGRTYVRNGSVCDLQINEGKVAAFVCGSELYSIDIKIEPLSSAAWNDIKQACAGQVGSLVELLQGKLSKGVMDIVTRPGSGLFPKPAEIDLDCSCPDWADMCKHVAAALYGIGARLDHEPELLFKLRAVDHLELISAAGNPIVLPSETSTIADSDLAAVFGIELEPDAAAPAVAPPPTAPVKSGRGKRQKAAPAQKRKPIAKGRTEKPVSLPPGNAKPKATRDKQQTEKQTNRRAATRAKRK